MNANERNVFSQSVFTLMSRLSNPGERAYIETACVCLRSFADFNG